LAIHVGHLTSALSIIVYTLVRDRTS